MTASACPIFDLSRYEAASPGQKHALAAEEGGAERRRSLAFFHQPNRDARIVALASRLAPVRSGPYPVGKFKSTTM